MQEGLIDGRQRLLEDQVELPVDVWIDLTTDVLLSCARLLGRARAASDLTLITIVRIFKEERLDAKAIAGNV